jgi:NAD(P)-dependent dehydrogenase (short-subunit alcohol dehydrogenase family)
MSSYTVAVAGGSGGLGRSITEAIVAAGRYEVVILSRKVEVNPGSVSSHEADGPNTG